MSTVLPLMDPAPRDAQAAAPLAGHASDAAAREIEARAARLRHDVGRAIAEFNMIEDGDRVMVCLSGGKDSHVMLDVLLQLQKRAPIRFSLTAVNLDQKQPGFPAHVLPDYLRGRGVAFELLEQDTYSVVTRVVPEGKTMCALCSRLRRGALYSHAAARGYTKIALGHHADDIVATLFMNLFFHAKLAAMPPKLRSDDGRHIVIRPLAYVREPDIAAYAAQRGFPIIPCTLCGSQPNLQRKQVQRMLDGWEHDTPGRIAQIARALGNVQPSLLADQGLFDFQGLRADPAAARPPCAEVSKGEGGNGGNDNDISGIGTSSEHGVEDGVVAPAEAAARPR